MEPPEPRTPDQQRDAAADLAVRVRRIELEPAGPSSGPSTPADTQGHRSHLTTWPTTPLTPPEGPGNPADDSRSGLPGGGTSSAPSRNAVKRLRSFGTDTTQPALSGDSRIPTSEPQNPTESPTLLAGISSLPGGAATDCSAVEMPLPSPASQPAGGMRQYLCYFLHRFLDYRAPELHSLAAMNDIPLQLEVPRSEPDVSPFYYCHLPSDGAAMQIAERSMLVKGFFEVFAEGESMDDLCRELKTLPPAALAPYRNATWKVVVDAWGAVYSAQVGLALINRLEFLPLDGKVQMVDPDVKFWIIAVDTQRGPGGLPEMPMRYYFCREVAVSRRSIIRQYSLTTRRYLGPTSMDTEMAFIMCNQAQVRPRSLVYDPFVGTGSILVAAAHYGAHTLGADIDARVICLGKVGKEGEALNPWTNFTDYGLPAPVGLLRCDAHTPPFRKGLEEVYDAIVTDPPYGVRAGGKKSVPKPHIKIKALEDHYPQTDPYPLGECLRDLLDMAARMLRVGGRLVYFLPVAVEIWKGDSDVPQHPMLAMVANSEQILTSRYSRRLITMQKMKPYCAAEAAAYHEAAGEPLMAIDTVHDTVYEQRAVKEPRVPGESRKKVPNPAHRRFRSKVV